MPKNKFKKLFLCFFALSLIFIAFSPALSRQTEIDYPKIGDLPGITTIRTPLPEYINYIFVFAISLAGLVAFVSIIWGGIAYLTSAGNPNSATEGKNRILAGFLGLIILFSSYLILKTINPELVGLKKAELPAAGRVILYSNNNCQGEKQAVFGSVTRLDFAPKSFQINAKAAELFVFFYEEENFLGDSYLQISSGKVDDCFTAHYFGLEKISSLSLVWKAPGVYLCTENLDEKDGIKFCPPDAKEIFAGAGQSIIENIKGIRIENEKQAYPFAPFTDPVQKENAKSECNDMKGDLIGNICYHPIAEYSYNAVLHEKSYYEGTCQIIEQTTSEIKDTIGSVAVFIKKSEVGDNVSETEGVQFCQEQDFGQPCTKFYRNYSIANLKSFNDYGDWNDKITSLKMNMKGSYLAVLFEDANFKGECELFWSSAPRLLGLHRMGKCRTSPIFGTWQSCVSSFKVIPLWRATYSI